MKADLSRGHRPDRKRGKAYNRVLLQQGRLLLDSDVAALTDTLNAQIHGLGQEVVGEGSTDYGFLITPGPQLAQFDTLGAVTRDGSSHALFRVSLDHGRKYLGRLPALYLDGTQGWGKVSIAVRRPITDRLGTLRLWARLPTGMTLVVGAPKISKEGWQVTVAGLDGENFKAYDVTLPEGRYSVQALTLAFDDTAAGPVPTREAFIGLIEGHETAGAEPRFWVRKGHYRLGGLAFELEQDRPFPRVSLPTASGAGVLHGDQAQDVRSGQRYVAYLEGWERLVTQVEDAGLLEQALGGTLDTSVRTRPVGQVKLARCNDNGALTPEAMLAAFRKRKLPAGTLTISTAGQVTARDPCAIPEVAGYTGGDNRLYRFEVHDAGDLSTFSIKWSRNNGAELFLIVKATASGGATRVELAPGADLRDGDLVELLDETVELGDAVQATLDAAGLTPSQRAKGPLYLVREVLDAPRQVELIDSAGNAVLLAHDVMAAAVAPSKLRRWHGVLKPADGVLKDRVLVYKVDGIEVKLAGPDGNPDLFRSGDYWQYEARRLYANDNGKWVASPHGPERLLAPLALLKFDDERLPVELVSWYAGRFSALAELGGDDVAFDGNRVGSASDTVQAALDELFLRQTSGACGHAELFPEANPTDDAARILNLIQTKLPKGGVINLRPGVYYLRSKLTFTNLSVELRGCPEAVIVSDLADTTTLSVGTGGWLTLSGLVVFCKTTAPALVEVTGNASLSVKECGLFHPGASFPGCGILTAGTTPTSFVMRPFSGLTYAIAYPLPETPAAMTAPRVVVEDSVLIARWGLSAPYLESLVIRGTVAHCWDTVVELSQQLVRVEVSDSAFATALPIAHFDSLRAQDPSAVAQHARTLLETVVLPSEPDGTAVHVRDLFGGSVTGSSFYGRLGFCAEFARALTLQGNSYKGTFGIRLDNVAESRVLGEHVDVQSSVDTENPMGIAVLRSAFGLIISDCTVSVENVSTNQNKLEYGAGVLLGTRMTPAESHERKLTGVLINNNHIRATGGCVWIRHEDDSDLASETPDRISICGNHIEQLGSYGIYYQGAPFDPPRPAEVLIAENQIDMPLPINILNTTSACVELSSGGASISSNTIHVRQNAFNVAFAFNLWHAKSSTISGNTVFLTSEAAPGSPGNYAYGLFASESDGIRVSQNVFKASGNTHVLKAVYCDGLTIENNDLGNSYGGVLIWGAVGSVIQSNRAQCTLMISGAGADGSTGVIADNVLEYGGALAPTLLSSLGKSYVGNAVGPHLILESIDNDWQVQNNRVYAGHIVIWPRFFTGQEFALFMQVVGNISETLTVGCFDVSQHVFFVNASADTKLMVSGNMATLGSVRVNSYSRLVMMNNMGSSIHHGTVDVGVKFGPIYNSNA